MENDKKNLNVYIKKRQELIDKLDSILKQSNNNTNTEDIKNILTLKNEITKLSDIINKIQTNSSEIDYYFKTGDILLDYYSTIERQYINNDNYIINNTKDRADLLDTYKNILYNKESNAYNDNNNCEICNIELTLINSESIMVCKKCGFTKYILIDSEKPSFREPVPENSYFAYKRINHFNEWLAQIQAKESTDIPTEIYDNILKELKKCRITDHKKLNANILRSILKKLKYNKYYEHIPHIINKLNGSPPPTIDTHIEDKLREMFKVIQEPFEECCPKERKNFLSYSYVLHKFTELLGLEQYKNSFKLLKSREKLLQQDKIWQCICTKLKWEFIPSV